MQWFMPKMRRQTALAALAFGLVCCQVQAMLTGRELALSASLEQDDLGTIDGGHKDLWPLEPKDYILFVLAAAVSFVAAGAGIGGGGVLLPLFLFVGGFSPRQAVALSNVTIMGGAVANLACNIKRRHPLGGGPLIDWDITLVLEPNTILGAILGFYLGVILPSWITTTTLFLLLGWITWKLLTKGWSTYKQETKELMHASKAEPEAHMPVVVRAEKADLDSDLAAPLLPAEDCEQCGEVLEPDSPVTRSPISNNSKAMCAASPCSSDSSMDEQTSPVTADPDQVNVPLGKLSLLLALSIWLVLAELAKAKTSCGSLWYWLSVCSVIPPAVLLTLGMRLYLLRKMRRRAQRNVLPRKGDLQWDSRTTLVYPAVCMIAGVVAGLFGVGGGIIKGPLLLELGTLPEVAAATSATMILFTSGSASVIYLHAGVIPPGYGAAFCLLGLVSAFSGQLGAMKMVKTLRHPSLIIFIMALLLGGSSLAVAVKAAMALEQAVHDPSLWLHFTPLCG